MTVGKTATYAVLGDPVAHSLSPVFQAAGFRAAGIDATYLAYACQADELAVTMRRFAGGNITIPHKAAAAALVASADPRVALLGVANTFRVDGDVLTLRNTDVDGVLGTLDHMGVPNTGWYLLGTGGSARAVVGAARERGAAISVRSRSPRRAEEFVSWCASLGVRCVAPEECAVVINATPVGLSASDALPLDVSPYPTLTHALDLTYRRAEVTRWVTDCRAHGLRAEDGRRMLLLQGAASWQLWFPGLTPPLAAMEAALDDSLA